ncbi:hypothetical protein BJY52DRAFT_1191184 [Lactarius psammicola]|nr:hypothetical protein BJY52DRAFT_1191184 [Lactarius psammicola]
MVSIIAAKVRPQRSAPMYPSPGRASFDIAPMHGTLPVHILAVQSSSSSGRPVSDAVLLVPAHHTDLVTYYAHIPRLPVSRPQARSSGALAVPVRSLVVPQTRLPTTMLAAAGPFVHVSALVSAPQIATYLAASAAGDKMSALVALTCTVSAI